jgi:heptosyltransferase-1
MADEFKNILIVKPSSLGDIVMTLPALTALRKTYPHAKITWLIRPEFAPLIEAHPHLDDIIHFDRKFLGKLWYHPLAFVALLKLISRLRRKKFDAVFDFQGLLRSGLMAWLSGAKRRFGPTTAREGAHLCYTDPIVRDQSSIHVVDYYLKFVNSAANARQDAQFVLPNDSQADDFIARILSEQNIAPENYTVLIPGSAHTEKCWPIERFAAVADRINSDYQLQIVTVGTASEAPINQKLKQSAKTPITDLTGRTNLKQLVSLLKNARLVITNDTGPGHIAAALNIPLVMIFGRANPIRLYPYNNKESVVAIEPFTRGADINNTHPKYHVKNIKTDDVYNKIKSQMKN